VRIKKILRVNEKICGFNWRQGLALKAYPNIRGHRMCLWEGANVDGRASP